MNVIGRTLWIVLFLSIACIIFYSVDLQLMHADGNDATLNESENMTVIPDSPLMLDITLKRIYMDGEVSEESLIETIWSLEDFWDKYESWQLIDMDESRLVFEMHVDDISPLLKLNGFFGLTEDGTLSIFNGKPGEADVIQSFFQIDMKKLEGSKHKQLLQGIPIKTKEDFAEVLETMRQYSLRSLEEK